MMCFKIIGFSFLFQAFVKVKDALLFHIMVYILVTLISYIFTKYILVLETHGKATLKYVCMTF